MQNAGADLVCLGHTKGGNPRHPLYVRGDQPFVPLFARDVDAAPTGAAKKGDRG
jgi:hypothetical protein